MARKRRKRKKKVEPIQVTMRSEDGERVLGQYTLRGKDAKRVMEAAEKKGVTLEQFALTGLPGWVSPMLYIAMGWVGLLPFLRLTRRYGFSFTSPLMWAAALSTIGGISDATEWPTLWPGVVEAHEVMHLAILAGMGCFFWSIDRCTRIAHEEALNPS